MKKIIWLDEFSVGVERIDDQHKEMLRIINKLIENQNISVDSEIISDALGVLREYTVEIFELEEQILEENGYPGLDQHKEKHEEFSMRSAEFCIEVMEKRKEVPNAILNFLCEWWDQHVLHEDMKYRSFFAEKGIS